MKTTYIPANKTMRFLTNVIDSCNNKDQFINARTWLLKLTKQGIISQSQYEVLEIYVRASRNNLILDGYNV